MRLTNEFCLFLYLTALKYPITSLCSTLLFNSQIVLKILDVKGVNPMWAGIGLHFRLILRFFLNKAHLAGVRFVGKSVFARDED